MLVVRNSKNSDFLFPFLDTQTRDSRRSRDSGHHNVTLAVSHYLLFIDVHLQQVSAEETSVTLLRIQRGFKYRKFVAEDIRTVGKGKNVCAVSLVTVRLTTQYTYLDADG